MIVGNLALRIHEEAQMCFMKQIRKFLYVELEHKIPSVIFSWCSWNE